MSWYAWLLVIVGPVLAGSLLTPWLIGLTERPRRGVDPSRSIRATLVRLRRAELDEWEADYLTLLRSTGWREVGPWYCPRCDGTGTGEHPHMTRAVLPPKGPAGTSLRKAPAPPPLPLAVHVYRESR